MVDTQIMLYAFYLEGKRGPSKSRQHELDKHLEQARAKCEASSELLRRLGKFYISAISITELCRHMMPDEMEWFSGVSSKLDVVAFDGRVAIEAARLVRVRNLKEKLCSHCLNAIAQHPCKVCRRLVASHQRINDAMIAASAEISDKVSVLYTFDGGLLSFGQHVKRCRITEPVDPQPEVVRGKQKTPQKSRTNPADHGQMGLFGLVEQRQAISTTDVAKNQAVAAPIAHPGVSSTADRGAVPIAAADPPVSGTGTAQADPNAGQGG
ncbi:type II toxin-antitoxin system VapC family toxin [Sorangium sp. KYC3313]|uniref:type II toxin-antitoxin system VapC family toxin n=1 Tax=Sorangium sp. KYC3313 TaxID=3449740 RepID=UPI003F8B75C9